MKDRNFLRVALIPGHTEKAGGARNKKTGINEFSYNSDLCKKLEKALNETGKIKAVTFYRNPVFHTYKSLKHISETVNKLGFDMCVEMHLNAYINSRPDGHSVLVFHKTKPINIVAGEHFMQAAFDTFGNRDRGIIRIKKKDRGWPLLYHTNMPCFLLEPFFISNDEALELGLKLKKRYIENLVKAFLKCKELYQGGE